MGNDRDKNKTTPTLWGFMKLPNQNCPKPSPFQGTGETHIKRAWTGSIQTPQTLFLDPSALRGRW